MTKNDIKFHIIISPKTQPNPYYIMCWFFTKSKFNGIVYAYSGGWEYSTFFYKNWIVLKDIDEWNNEDEINEIKINWKWLADTIYDFLESKWITFDENTGNLVLKKWKLIFKNIDWYSISTSLTNEKPISAWNVFF